MAQPLSTQARAGQAADEARDAGAGGVEGVQEGFGDCGRAAGLYDCGGLGGEFQILS